jgi:hypothetical protein
MIAAQDDRQGQPMSAPPLWPIVFGTCREILFGVVTDLCDLAASHGCSAADAAWRGDEATLRTHLVQMKSAMGAAIKAFNQLVSVGAKASAA